MGGQGTELEVVISYHPPAGDLGAGIAKWLNPVLEKMVRQDIMNFKEYIETKHQPSSSNAGTSNGVGGKADNPNIIRSEAESVQEGKND